MKTPLVDVANGAGHGLLLETPGKRVDLMNTGYQYRSCKPV